MDPEQPQPAQSPGISTNAKIILACTIALIIFLSGAMFFMWKYLDEMTSSPFVYGAHKTSQANGGAPLQCTCSLQKGIQQSTFYFNSTDLWNEPDKEPFINSLAFNKTA